MRLVKSCHSILLSQSVLAFKEDLFVGSEQIDVVTCLDSLLALQQTLQLVEFASVLSHVKWPQILSRSQFIFFQLTVVLMAIHTSILSMVS